ncbi:MAG: M48 family metallopeptidase [Candidatus Latescibacterota bacterium]
MNIYAIIILAALLLEFAVDTVSGILNMRSLGKTLPPEFRDIFDEEAYRKSQEYTRVKTRFGLFSSAASLAAALAFWFAGGFNWLDLLVRSRSLEPVLTGVVYIGLLFLFRGLLSLPFQIYDTFVIEERFGFNRTTPGTFIKDRLKGLLLGVLLGGPLLGGILYFFMYAGDLAWLYVWLAVSGVSVLLQFIIPVWIMPLFNKFRPLEEGELRSSILGYADSVRFPLRGVFVIDSSKRSSKSNAFFTGFGRNKRIALFDTLVEQHTVPEIVGVIAHEVGHYKRKHILQGIAIGILHTGVLLFLLSFFIRSETLAAAFFMDQVSVYAGFVFFALLYTPVDFVLSVFLQILSRRNEYQADRFAIETTGRPEAMAAALKKLARNNLSNLTPHPFHVFLHYSHPPVLERIREIKRLSKIQNPKSKVAPPNQRV